MAILNSYVCLPEGTIQSDLQLQGHQEPPQKSSSTKVLRTNSCSGPLREALQIALTPHPTIDMSMKSTSQRTEIVYSWDYL